jgi:hypothetical protein
MMILPLALPYAPWSKDVTIVYVHPCHIGNPYNGFINHLVGGLEHIFKYFSIYWEESSQLTFIIFFRGVGIPPTSHDKPQ